MSERDPGWKASVDGVVLEFDEVTRHLRRRQGQAVRVAWSVVGATALAMGALIGLDLVPSGGPAAVQPGPPLAVLTPGTSTLPTTPGLGLGLPTYSAIIGPSPAPAPSPASSVTAASSTPRPPHHAISVTAPVLAALPVSPPAALPPVVTASPEPTPPSSTPSGGLVDALVASVLHGAG